AVLIEKLRGPAELGIYTALAYSYAAANRVASAMGEAACARLASYYARGERRSFARVLGKLLLLAGTVSAAGLVLAVVAGGPVGRPRRLHARRGRGEPRVRPRLLDDRDAPAPHPAAPRRGCGPHAHGA